MRFCKYCGSQVSDDVEQCPQCTKYIGVKSPTADNQSHQNTSISKQRFAILRDKRVIALIAVAIIVLIVALLFNSGRCDASGCNNKAVSGMSYCYNHKCAVTSCDSKRYSYSNYCYSHYLLYDDDAESAYSPKVYSYELKISNVMCCDFAIHDPDPPGHNPHCHFMLTMRAIDENGKWLPKSRKVYDLDENGERIKLPSGRWKSHKEDTVDWNEQYHAEEWRHGWEIVQNKYLELAGSPERIDMRSYERQGLDIIPTVHMGTAVSALERKGIAAVSACGVTTSSSPQRKSQ